MSNLGVCGTCGNQVSTNAKKCPHCGAVFKKKTSLFVWAVAALFGIPFLFGIFKGANTSSNNTNSSQSVASVNQTGVAASQPAKTQSDNWGYDADTDKMRGTKTYYAGTASKNNADFQFPYHGKSLLHIQLRNQAGKNNVILTIDKGQFDCGIDGCNVAIKFDDRPIKSYQFGRTDSGATDIIFLSSGEKGFIDTLKASKRVIVEAPFFQEGRKQFEFETSGLEWKF